MKDKNETASRIKKIRLSLGLTMKEFGKKFNPPASDSIVSRWERGVSLPSNDRLKRISEIANVSTTYLTTGKYTEYDLTKGNKTLFIDEFKNSREEARKDTLEEIEKFGTIDMAEILKGFNIKIRERFEFGEENHKVSFNGHNLTERQLQLIGDTLLEFTDIDVTKYSDDSLEEIYQGFMKLIEDNKE